MYTTIIASLSFLAEGSVLKLGGQTSEAVQKNGFRRRFFVLCKINHGSVVDIMTQKGAHSSCTYIAALYYTFSE